MMSSQHFLLVLVVALLLDVVLGDPPNRWHPVAWMGAVIKGTISQVPRNPAWLAMLGGGMTAIGGALLFGLPVFLLAKELDGVAWIGPLGQALLLKPTFSIQGLVRAGARVQSALSAGELVAARSALGRDLVSRRTAELTAGEVASGTVESLAENSTDSVLAPLLAFAVGGVAAAWVYRYMNTADAMIGYQHERYRHLGFVAARLDDGLNWIPARIAGPLVALASGCCGGSIRAAWAAMRSQHDATQSPNAGWTMAAAAGGLGVRLEKRDHYRLGLKPDLPDASQVKRAGKLVWLVSLMSVLLTALLGLLIRVWI